MKDYYDDIVGPAEIINGQPEHHHRRISDAETHLHHRESDRRLAVLEAGQVRHSDALEQLGDRITGAVGDATRGIDQMRRELSGLLRSAIRYLLIVAVAGLVVVAGLAGASVYIKAVGVEMASGRSAAPAPATAPAAAPTPEAAPAQSVP